MIYDTVTGQVRAHGTECAQHKGGLVSGQDAVGRVHARPQPLIALSRSIFVRCQLLRQLRTQLPGVQEVHSIAKLQLHACDST